MTIPRRADTASGDPHALRTKLLAELPHVGAEPMDAPTREPKSSHPAFAEQYDCDEIPVEVTRTQTRRFVDHAHTEDDWQKTQIENRYIAKERPIHRQRHPGGRPQATPGMSGLLSLAHQQVAPFAGLIVTAALVAVAALLFHMMAGGSKPSNEFDEIDLPGFQVHAANESKPLDESAPLAETSGPAESVEHETTIAEPSGLTPSENSSLQTPAMDVSPQAAPPLAQASVGPTAPLGHLSFPQTNSPLALDYSKALDPDLQQLPEVAERTEPAATDGINR